MIRDVFFLVNLLNLKLKLCHPTVSVINNLVISLH